ncbi:DNA primase [Empedobacter falsenii]|uniref:Toprim domain-containing protein n=1 Tax=Empedobacter falsenii TaxID=343874 RepID=A0A427BT35_9FLAO|nr:toprim domain-containing protein [Empedobacter falsenii]RRT94194.1 toprim domain-containing protein [Empedobacter falsenii]RRT94388.1 toprim domain-containing protein [Empedobacter falsenii]
MSLIKNDFIDRLLADTDILDVFRANQHEVKKVGTTNYVCKSPINDERTESCMIDIRKQMFFDKSANISGNAISYYTKVRKLSYREAIQELAKLNNVTVEYESDKDASKYIEQQNKIDEFRPILKSVQKQFVEQLNQLEKSHPAWKEIKKRGYTKEIVKEYGIGFAPGGQFLYNLLSQSGKVSPGFELGLINEKNNDKLNFRLTYAIYDKQNQIIGFASRALRTEDKVKWMNPITSLLYDKSKQWYGINFALNQIAKTKTAWLVEGYNDVIAWQENGIMNTISPYGKEFGTGQIAVLKKFAQKVFVCLDNDGPGIEAMLRNIPKLFASGLNVEVCQLPEHEVDGKIVKLDPDEFIRIYKSEIEESESTLEEFLKQKGFIKNGFAFLMDHLIVGDNDIEKAEGVKRCVKIIDTIEDVMFKNLYTDMLEKFSKFKKKFINDLQKDISVKKFKEEKFEMGEYILPPELQHKDVNDYLEMIKTYGFFQEENQIWMVRESKQNDPPYYFDSISNFSIEIIQHMNDDKFPKKLFRVKNTMNLEMIFDDKATTMLNTSLFCAALESKGDFIFEGDAKQLLKLKKYLFRTMGTGRAVDVLGWNPEGFFVWNNKVTIPDVGNINMDKNGIFRHNDITYYVPSANEIYANNPTRYLSQKRVIVSQANCTLTEYLGQLRKVHRGHAITGILFTLASAFQDFIAPTIKGFPMILLYGAASSGKDQLSHCLRSFFGKPQSVIALGSKKSTGKAQIREFAQFANVITHLSEYQNGDNEIDETLKGIWDRNGYKFGTIESRVSSDEVPILSSALVTGNYFPTNEALITRLLWEEMHKTEFTQEEKNEYNKLDDMAVDGLSSFMTDILLKRSQVERRFVKEFRLWTEELTLRKSFKGLPSRIMTNHAVIASMYEIFKEDIRFPFTREEMLEHFDVMVSNQRRRLDNESISNRFWQRFVAALRASHDKKLFKDRDFKLDGNHLYIQWTNTYNAIQPSWYMSFEQSCPSKNDFRKRMMDDASFVEEIKSVKFGTGENAKVTTALMFDLNKLKEADRMDVMYAIENQAFSTATPLGNEVINNTSSAISGQVSIGNDTSDDDLPF